MKNNLFQKSTVIMILLLSIGMMSLLYGDVFIKSKVTRLSFENEKVVGTEEVYHTESWFSNAFARVNIGSKDTTMIVDFNKKLVYVLHAGKKKYAIMDIGALKSQLDQMLGEGASEEQKEMMMAMLGTFVKFEGKVEKTGVTKKIGNWNCSQYIISTEVVTGKSTTEQWNTKDITTNMGQLNHAMNFVFSAFPGFEKFLADLNAMEGCPVLSIMNRQEGDRSTKTTSELVEFGEKNPPVDTYNIPKGYKNIEE